MDKVIFEALVVLSRPPEGFHNPTMVPAVEFICAGCLGAVTLHKEGCLFPILGK